MSDPKFYDQDSDLKEVLVGRRVVAAEFPIPDPDWVHDWDLWEGRGLGDFGRLTLDDGTVIYAVGHDGGCICGAGDYELTKLSRVDNVITNVEVIEPSENEGDVSGVYSIFVYADHERINLAEFEGSDGNGYYGTGFRLTVFHPEASR